MKAKQHSDPIRNINIQNCNILLSKAKSENVLNGNHATIRSYDYLGKKKKSFLRISEIIDVIIKLVISWFK
jgi:hypothetical protein